MWEHTSPPSLVISQSRLRYCDVQDCRYLTLFTPICSFSPLFATWKVFFDSFFALNILFGLYCWYCYLFSLHSIRLWWFAVDFATTGHFRTPLCFPLIHLCPRKRLPCSWAHRKFSCCMWKASMRFSFPAHSIHCVWVETFLPAYFDISIGCLPSPFAIAPIFTLCKTIQFDNCNEPWSSML